MLYRKTLMIDQSSPTATIDALRRVLPTGDVEGLRQLTDKQAAMYGYLNG